MRHALTILSTPDVSRSVAFYNALLDRRPHVHVDVYAEYILDGDQRIGLYAQETLASITGQVATQPSPTGLSPAELYFYPGDLDAAMARAEAAGARLLSPLHARPWGDDAVYYADPFGVIIVLARTTTSSPSSEAPS